MSTLPGVALAHRHNLPDLEELLGLLRVSASDEMVRCSKVRSMFAMRACRKSVMIGHPLNMRQMKEAR